MGLSVRTWVIMAKVTSELLLKEIKKLGVELKAQGAELKEHRAILTEHSALLKTQGEELKAQGAELKAQRSELKEHRSILNDHSELFKKLDAKIDIRFEFLKDQILETRTEMKSEFALVRQDLKTIREHTGHITERVAALEIAQKRCQTPQHQS